VSQRKLWPALQKYGNSFFYISMDWFKGKLKQETPHQWENPMVSGCFRFRCSKINQAICPRWDICPGHKLRCPPEGSWHRSWGHTPCRPALRWQPQCCWYHINHWLVKGITAKWLSHDHNHHKSAHLNRLDDA
jgi:hypothetical protein